MCLYQYDFNYPISPPLYSLQLSFQHLQLGQHHISQLVFLLLSMTVVYLLVHILWSYEFALYMAIIILIHYCTLSHTRLPYFTLHGSEWTADLFLPVTCTTRLSRRTQKMQSNSTNLDIKQLGKNKSEASLWRDLPKHRGCHTRRPSRRDGRRIEARTPPRRPEWCSQEPSCSPQAGVCSPA